MIFIHKLKRNKGAMIGFLFISFWVIVGVITLFYLPHDPLQVDTSLKLLPPSSRYWMGTDNYGRDIFSRLLSGAKITLWLSVVSVAISMVIGTLIGTFSGFYPNIWSSILMRIMDGLQAFPMLILVISISIALGRNSLSAMLAVGISGIPQFARVLYAQTLSIKNSPFMEGEKAIGLKEHRLLFRHILPNCITPLLVRTTLSLGFSILTISSLSFLGIGVKPPTPEWGAMISDARSYIISGEWWMMVFPGLAIASLVLSFNLFGDGLQEILDYRSS